MSEWARRPLHGRETPSVSNHPGGENSGDNLQDTHCQPLPSHATLISADLCGSRFHRSQCYWMHDMPLSGTVRRDVPGQYGVLQAKY
ncbi:hypothetical protein [Oligosphaera ethanolica]|uniref:Uncharacterized protein n=1 Tax=Oligosphaera ethanolica TaxID=760260 RepID=A0AAE4AQB0_9BACT|nr:hypothetical protein [Oligosphaera ethanolica]MDQ0291355.1 hypothetical protein [Oligosphaera ethanolica]